MYLSYLPCMCVFGSASSSFFTGRRYRHFRRTNIINPGALACGLFTSPPRLPVACVPSSPYKWTLKNRARPHFIFIVVFSQRKSLEAYWELFGGSTNYSVIAETTVKEIISRVTFH